MQEKATTWAHEAIAWRKIVVRRTEGNLESKDRHVLTHGLSELRERGMHCFQAFLSRETKRCERSKSRKASMTTYLSLMKLMCTIVWRDLQYHWCEWCARDYGDIHHWCIAGTKSRIQLGELVDLKIMCFEGLEKCWKRMESVIRDEMSCVDHYCRSVEALLQRRRERMWEIWQDACRIMLKPLVTFGDWAVRYAVFVQNRTLHHWCSVFTRLEGHNSVLLF